MLRRNRLFRRSALAAAGVVAVVGVLYLTAFHPVSPADEGEEQASAAVESTGDEFPAGGGEDHGESTDRAAESVQVAKEEVWHGLEFSEEESRQASPPPQTGRPAIDELHGISPDQWGEFVTGVRRRIDTDDKKVALTLDACDAGYDARMIEILRDRQIPATLFVAGHWVRAHGDRLQEFAADPLFEIANHGLRHLPCSVSGKDAVEIEGTADIHQVYEEIEENAQRIQSVTGERPRYYRSGTAHYDEVCVRIARKLGHEIVNFDVVGDQGAIFSAEQVEDALLDAEPGSIVVLHMNQPDSGSAEGLENALPILEERGFRFVTLSEVSLK